MAEARRLRNSNSPNIGARLAWRAMQSRLAFAPRVRAWPSRARRARRCSAIGSAPAGSGTPQGTSQRDVYCPFNLPLGAHANRGVGRKLGAVVSLLARVWSSGNFAGRDDLSRGGRDSAAQARPEREASFDMRRRESERRPAEWEPPSHLAGRETATAREKAHHRDERQPANHRDERQPANPPRRAATCEPPRRAATCEPPRRAAT